MNEKIFRTVADIIIDKNCLTEKEVTPEARFKEDLGMDSLDTTEMAMCTENALHITIHDGEYEDLKTVGDFVALVESKL